MGDSHEIGKMCCSIPDEPPRDFGSDVDPERASLIMLLSNQWVHGTKVYYHFLSGVVGTFPEGSAKDRAAAGQSQEGDSNHKHIVRKAFAHWMEHGVKGVIFEETSDLPKASIRIGFVLGNGSWSFLGSYARNIYPQERRTMNFGWEMFANHDGTDDTALHEVGHALSLQHEHQNPDAGIVWDEAAVIRDLGGSPNFWDEGDVRRNILNKVPQSAISGTNWDPDSIMHYEFKAGLISSPVEYKSRALKPAPGLSQFDIALVSKMYLLPSQRYTLSTDVDTLPLLLDVGEQADCTLSLPSDGCYTMQTSGKSDVVMVLFEEPDEQLAADDDSGLDTNALIELNLRKEKKYILRTRMYSEIEKGSTSLSLVRTGGFKPMPAREVSGDVTGENCVRVHWKDGQTFAQVEDKVWHEFTVDGIHNFTFVEENRDAWSVYLRDAGRQVYIQIDLLTESIMLELNGNGNFIFEGDILTSTRLPGW